MKKILLKESQSLEKVIEIAKYALENVPFYKEIYSDAILSRQGFTALPVINREILNNTEKVYRVISRQKKPVVYSRTSGSTGKYMSIYWSIGDYKKSMFPLWYLRYKSAGIHPDDKYCFFFTSFREAACKDFIFEKNRIGASKVRLSEAKWAKIIQKFVGFQPKWLFLQPSTAVEMIRYMKEKSIPPISSVIYIELTGEILLNSEKKLISDFWMCEVRNMYGSNEFNGIAYECECGNMHLIGSNVYVEILDEDNKCVEMGEEGNIVISSLTNHMMPLIRYNIEDIGSLSNEECKCGLKAKTLKVIKGRKCDYIKTNYGDTISSYEFVHVFDLLNKYLNDPVVEFQVTQLSFFEFRVQIVAETERFLIKKCFVQFIENKYLKTCKYEFVFCNRIKLNKAGKKTFFIGMGEENYEEDT